MFARTNEAVGVLKIMKHLSKAVFVQGSSCFILKSIVRGHDGAVEDLAYHESTRKLASVGGSQLQVWSITPHGMQVLIGIVVLR